MMDYAQIKQHVSMRRLLDQLGVALDRHGRCACPLHGGDNKTAFSVHSQDQGWTCHTKCDASGDIFTFMEKRDGITNAEARVRICEMFNLETNEPAHKPATKRDKTVVNRTEYVYRDKDGSELYRVKRVDYADGRKDCFQEYRGKPTLPVEVRTLYNYHKIHGNTYDFICLCEGEKTADALCECGYIGTTNPLGSKNWEQKYADLLKGQSVLVMPDADQHGEAWRDEVMKSLQGIASEVRVIEMPDKFIRKHPEFKGHDFADMLKVYGKETSIQFMLQAIENAKALPFGADADILGQPSYLFSREVERAKAGISSTLFNMNEWLPSMDVAVKKGDVVTLMGVTGLGKTRLLHNIPFHIRRLNYAIFDLELSLETLAIRYGAMENRMAFNELGRMMDSKKPVKPVTIDHVFLQKIRQVTVEKIAERVDLLEKITNRQIHVVAIDYIGLMKGKMNAFERVSNNVEDFKSYISDSGRVGLLTTQISRPEDKSKGVFKRLTPFDAKQTGSIENSSQELFGFWRDEHSRVRLHGCCLKYTHGDPPSDDIELHADNLLITEATGPRVVNCFDV